MSISAMYYMGIDAEEVFDLNMDKFVRSLVMGSVNDMEEIGH